MGSAVSIKHATSITIINRTFQPIVKMSTDVINTELNVTYSYDWKSRNGDLVSIPPLGAATTGYMTAIPNPGSIALNVHWQNECRDQMVTTVGWLTDLTKHSKFLYRYPTRPTKFDYTEYRDSLVRDRKISFMENQFHHVHFTNVPKHLTLTFYGFAMDDLIELCNKVISHAKKLVLAENFEAAELLTRDVLVLSMTAPDYTIQECKWEMSKVLSDTALFQFTLGLSYEQDIKRNKFELADNLYRSAIAFTQACQKFSIATDRNMMFRLDAYHDKLEGNNYLAAAIDIQKQQLTMTKSANITHDCRHYSASADLCDDAVAMFKKALELFKKARVYDARIPYLHTMIERSIDQLEVISRNQRLHALNGYIKLLDFKQPAPPTLTEKTYFLEEIQALQPLSLCMRDWVH